MADAKLSMILIRLRAKTIAGELKWEKTEEEGEYQVSLPQYSIRISRDRSFTKLAIFDDSGDFIESLSVADISDPGVRNTLESLYSEARRIALGVDEALDNILNDLK